jgi:Tc toxin complex TcA C-terminal TcB-binding domain/ABC toxin N-terminal region/Neuraminidase-like domain
MSTRAIPDQLTVLAALTELGFASFNAQGDNDIAKVREQLGVFQKAWNLQPTGDLDNETAILIIEVLHAHRIGVQCKQADPCGAVRGRVSGADGEAAPGLDVQLFAQTFRAQKKLADLKTDSDGKYAIAYPTSAVNAQTALVVQVYDGSTLAAQSDPQFNPKPLLHVDLTVGASHLHGPTELEQITAGVQNLVAKTALGDLTAADVTYLAGATAWTPQQLTYLIIANELQAKRSIAAAFFYALLREDALAGSSVTRLQSRFTIDLSTDLTALYYDIVLLDPVKITAAAQAAITARVVPSSLSASLQTILATLARSAADAQAYFQTQVPQRIFNSIAVDVQAGKAQQLQSVLQTNVQGDWTQLASGVSAVGFSDGTTAPAGVALSDLLAADPTLMTDLAPLLTAATATATATTPTSNTPTATPAATAPKMGMSTATPSTTTVPPPSRTAKATAAFVKALANDNAATLPESAAVLALLQKNPSFDLVTGNVTKFLEAQSGDTSQVREPLKALQRVFKLAPTYQQASALLAGGIRSAAHVAAMGQSRFVTRFSKNGTFGQNEARRVYHRAVALHTASGFIAAELHSLGATLADAITHPKMAETLQAVSASNPNLKSLFYLIDLCECQDCNSVTSASAYLVDVLQFLKNREVVDTTLAPPYLDTKTAKDVLFARRPDIGDLDLSCDNTNVTLPYIDIVNELLENIVSPDPGFSWAGAAPLAAGVAPPSLVQALVQNGLPFTNQAFIQGPISPSAPSLVFAIRDADAVCKLTQTSGNTYNVRNLRQTFQTADQLNAAPEYQNNAAYDVLRASNIAFHLPFDLYHQESRGYFTQFGIARSDLMRALATGGTPAPSDIAADALGIAGDEHALIVTANPGQQPAYWNTGAPASTTMRVVDTFLTKTELQYADLQDLLGRRFINPNHNLFIHHNDSSCDTTQKIIQNLDDNALDLIHRFLRLQKRLGWSIDTTDNAIMAARFGSGHGALDDALLSSLSDLQTLQTRLSSVSIDNLIAWYDQLSTENDPASAYSTVFYNQTANGVVDQLLTVASVTANQSAPAASQKHLSDVDAQALAIAVNLAPSDLTLLIQAAGNPAVTFASLTALWANASLASALTRSITDYLLLEQMTGVAPLASPSAGSAFIAESDRMATASVRPADLQFYLTFTASDLANRTLPDANVTTALAAIQKGLQSAYTKVQSPANGALTTNENKAGARALLAQLPTVQSAALGSFEAILDGTYSADPVAFLTTMLSAYLPIGPVITAESKLPPDVTAVNNAQTALDAAQAQLAAATTPALVAAAELAITGAATQLTNAQLTLQTDQFAFLSLVLSGVSAYLYAQARETIIVTALATPFRLTQPMASALVEGAQLGGRTLLDILSDQSLIDTNPQHSPPVLPALSALAFPAQYGAVRLLNQAALFSASLSLTSDTVAWLLANAAALGWLRLDGLPYQTGGAAIALTAWDQLVDALAFIGRYPPAANPADANAPFTIQSVFALAAAPGTTLGALLDRLAAVTGWDRQALTDLDSLFKYSTPDLSAYRSIGTYLALEKVTVPLRIMGVTVGAAQTFIGPQLNSDDAAALRQALKARYDVSTWLGVLKTVIDPLRQQKRDALVAHILANSPSMQSSDDLFDYILMDVEMCSCMSTSRIVAAHGTVQLFVQRCLLGIEPTAVADAAADDGWNQWQWMNAYRVWQANREIFLWPENWIDETLRDDQSEIYDDLQNALRQNPLTDDGITSATIDYLQALDDIAYLEVMTMYYEERTLTMHVFARTKGGDPTVYYYRTFIQEQEWTPWQKVELDITGDILMAFIRDSRLTLAWPIISEQPNDDQAINIPVAPTTPQPVDKTERAYQIQLAVSEYANNKWQPKRTSKEWLDWVDGPGYYQKLPDKDLFRFIPLDLRSAGFSIMAFYTDGGTYADGSPAGSGTHYLGAFSLAGCKGYPEPIAGDGINAVILPTFKDTTLTDLRFLENGSAEDLTILTYLRREWVTLLKQTPPGTFKVTYPQDLSLIDLVLFLFEIWQRAQGNAANPAEGFASVARSLFLPLGTFMPYFFDDGYRGYVAIPGYYSATNEKQRFVRETRFTFSNALTLLQDIIALVKKYLLIFEQDPTHNLINLIKQLVQDPDYKSIRTTIVTWASLTYAVEFDNFYHPLVCALRKTIYTDGIPGLMKRETQLQQTGFSFQQTYDPTDIVLKSYPTQEAQFPYPVEDLDFSLSGAYSSYNWELFFHLPFEIAVRLSKDQQFQDAMNWFHYIFDPTDASSGTVPQKYWKTKPFYLATADDYRSQRIDQIMNQIAADPTGEAITDLAFAISQWRDNPFEPFVVARSRTVAFQQALLMAYLNNVIAWGDSLFTQFTMETVAQATQLYVLADKLLGPQPRIVPPVVQPPTESFNQLEASIDLFGNALLDMENLIPDVSLLPHGGAELPPGLSLSSLYFCIPPNSNLLQFWTTVADRLFKIRNCQDITGTPRPLALFSPPIDPGALVAAAAAGLSPSEIVAGLNAPLPYYRFVVMVQKAADLAQQVVSLGAALLSALEKRDGEALQLLKANQELLVLNLVKAVKQQQINEAGVQIDVIQKSIDMTTYKSQYYHSRPFMNDQESLAQSLTTAALVLQSAALALSSAAGIGHLIPWLGIGAAGFGGSPQANANYGGSNIGNSASAWADVSRQTGGILQTKAGLATQLGSFQRRQDEWNFQAGLADKELIQLGRQLAAATLRQDIATKDLAAHQQSIDNANATLQFLQNKFTNQELYEYLIDQISGVYFQAYQLAFDCAQKAQHCFQYELGNSETYLSYGYWDSLRKGLFAGEALLADIKRMDKAYYDENKREYELTKTVSLAQLDALALLSLKNTGSCTFNLPEVIFDLDHPGHYFRRLKTVALTVPCVAGPYTSVSCTLSLVGNRYRATADLTGGYLENASGDSRFTYNVGSIQQIATSQGQSDNGLFDFSFKDERYLPFEGQGAISSWRIDLPQAYQQFDYSTITDVLLNIKYTARDGGSSFLGAAQNQIKDSTAKMVIDAKTTGLTQGYNVRLEFPDEWFTLQQSGTVSITVPSASLPFFAQGHTPALQSATWLARINGNPATFTMSLNGASFNLAQNATLNKLCSGASAAVAFDAPFTLATVNAGSVQELSLIVHYTLGS